MTAVVASLSFNGSSANFGIDADAPARTNFVMRFAIALGDVLGPHITAADVIVDDVVVSSGGAIVEFHFSAPLAYTQDALALLENVRTRGR